MGELNDSELVFTKYVVDGKCGARCYINDLI